MTFNPNKRLIIISDGTGETAAQMIRAALVQFGQTDIVWTRYKNVRTQVQIESICEEAEQQGDLIIYTLVSPELRTFLAQQASQKAIPCVDLLGPLLLRLGHYFGYEPKAIAGLLHDVNEHYFKRIEAMEYTIAHDDGRDLEQLHEADLIILGISRTSKTPLSMYLSHQGWKVANIPLIEGCLLPETLFIMDPRKIVGLTIQAQDLATIRRNRLERLGQHEGGEYADLLKVNQEIEYANHLFRKHRRWSVFNVTGKALEETASEIMKLMYARGIRPQLFQEHVPFN